MTNEKAPWQGAPETDPIHAKHTPDPGAKGTEIIVLTDLEKARLEELETIVERYRREAENFLAALREIQASRLYRETHGTFRDYLRDRWNISPSYFGRLKFAGAVVEEARRISGDVAHGQPPSERAVREVTDLPVEEAAVVLVKATVEARAEGREAPTVSDVRKARGGKLEENRGFRALPRRPATQRAESAVTMLETATEELVEIGLDRLAKGHVVRLRAIVETLSDLPTDAKAKVNKGKRRPSDGMEIARSAAGILNGIHGNDSERAEAIAFMRRWLDAHDGASLEESVETAPELVEAVPDVLTCDRCGEEAPLGGRVEHRWPCVKPPRAAVEPGQICSDRLRTSGKRVTFRLVVRVDEDRTVVYRDSKTPNLEQKSTVATFLEKTIVHTKPDPKIVALFEKPIVDAPVAPRRRRK